MIVNINKKLPIASYKKGVLIVNDSKKFEGIMKQLKKNYCKAHKLPFLQIVNK